MMTQSPRSSPRAEHLQQQKLLVEASPLMADKFPELKALTIDLGYYDSEGFARCSQIKYTFNLEHAKSMFCVACQNQECVRGNFELSAAIAGAVAARETSVTGEIRCQGWRSRTTIDTVPCHNLLRYTLTLDYHGA